MSLSVGAAKTGIKRREACIISDARASFTNDLFVDFYSRSLDFERYFRFGDACIKKDFPTTCEYFFYHRERIITENLPSLLRHCTQVIPGTIRKKEKLYDEIGAHVYIPGRVDFINVITYSSLISD